MRVWWHLMWFNHLRPFRHWDGGRGGAYIHFSSQKILFVQGSAGTINQCVFTFSTTRSAHLFCLG